MPAAEMSDAYSRETLALKQEVENYVKADLYDPERPKIVAVRRARIGAAAFPTSPRANVRIRFLPVLSSSLATQPEGVQVGEIVAGLRCR